MTRRFRDIHTLLVPTGVLFAAFIALLLTTREPEQRVMLVQMATGLAVLVSGWLLLKSSLDRITMAAEGFDENVERLEKDISQVDERVARVERIPQIRRVLEAQAAKEMRDRIGGPDTPGPDDPRMPTFNP